MSKQTLSLPILLLLIFNSGILLKLVNGEAKTWCVAKPSSSAAELASNINYCCDQIGDRCNIIKEGGPCYSPNSDIYHASVVMNLYYQLYGRNLWNCDFRGTGLITVTNPSHGNCQFPA